MILRVLVIFPMIWLNIPSSAAQQEEVYLLKFPQLKLLACVRHSNSNDESGFFSDSHSQICVQYYEERISWYEAHATCYSTGLALASVQTDTGLDIYSSEWIDKHRVWESSGEHFAVGAATSTWIVNAHRFWYGTRGPALADGTLLTHLEGIQLPSNDPRDEDTCVTLTGSQIQYVNCRVPALLNVRFACVPESPRLRVYSSDRVESSCPPDWQMARVNGSAIGKCYKELFDVSANVTWDRARGMCFDWGGDLLSGNNDAERIWLEKYSDEIQSRFHNKSNTKELWLFVNLHDYLYCIQAWCWSGKVIQSTTNFPDWNYGEPNNLGPKDIPEDCGVLSIRANPQSRGLNDISCNYEYFILERHTGLKCVVLCEFTNHKLLTNCGKISVHV